MNQASCVRSTALVFFVTLLACDKPRGGDDATKGAPSAPGIASVTAATATADDSCGAFVEKMKTESEKKSGKPAAPDDLKRMTSMYTDVCHAIKPATRACVKNAASMPEIDKCLEPEMDKVRAIAVGGTKTK